MDISFHQGGDNIEGARFRDFKGSADLGERQRFTFFGEQFNNINGP